jgi:hypothetical protein
MTKCKALIYLNWVTPKAAAEHELLFNKLTSIFGTSAQMYDHMLTTDCYEFSHAI